MSQEEIEGEIEEERVAYSDFELLPPLKMSCKTVIEEYSDRTTTALELESLELFIEIAAGTAIVTSTMTFFNSTKKVLEGELIFPLVKDGTIHGYGLDIDGVMVDAVPVPKEKARIAFEQTVREGGPQISVAEMVDAKTNCFKTKVYPMPPEGRRKVKVVVLSKLLDDKDGQVLFWNVQKPKSLKNFKFSMSSPNGTSVMVRRSNGEFEGVDNSLLESSLDANADFNGILIKAPRPQGVVTEKDPDSGYTYFSSTISNIECHPKKIEEGTTIKKATVFFDVSSSRRFSKWKEELEILKLFMEKNEGVEIDFITFSHDIHEKRSFLKFDDLDSFTKDIFFDGGTCVPLKQICQVVGSQVIILLTDGISNYGEDVESALSEMVYSTPIYSISSSPISAYILLRFLARNSGGAFFDISGIRDVTSIVEKIGIEQFGIKNVIFEESDASEVFCTEINNNNSVTVYGRLLKNEVDISIDFGGGYVIKTMISAKDTMIGGENSTIVRTLWAQQKINSLSLFGEKHKDEITQLGIEYGIVTENTSLIVLSDLSQYLKYKILPPKSLKSVRKSYLNSIMETEKSEEELQKQKIERVFTAWNQRVRWHQTDFKSPTEALKETSNNAAPNNNDNNAQQQQQQQQTRVLPAPTYPPSEREKSLFMAKAAEQAERYSEMYDYMKKLSEDSNHIEMSVEERNLLSVSMKNIIGERRSSRQKLFSFLGVQNDLECETEEEKEKRDKKKDLINQYIKKISEEIDKNCDKMISLTENLVTNCSSDESFVFMYKLLGDYYRYKCEVRKDEIEKIEEKKEPKEEKEEKEEKEGEGEEEEEDEELKLLKESFEEVKLKAKEAYKKSGQYAQNLPTTHPIRLGLKLNLSVFAFEICGNKELATRIAKGSFEDAIEELDSLTEEDYKDSTLIMQLLKDNLTLWTDGDAAEPEDDDLDDDLDAPAAPPPGPQDPQAAQPSSSEDQGRKASDEITSTASIKVKSYVSGAKYMETIRKASGAKASYKEYLKHKRENYEESTSFFLDVADYFLTNLKNKDDLGIRILSNITELGLNDIQLQRIMGYRLDVAKKYEDSIRVFSSVLKNKPEEPQSYRDLALVIEKTGDFEKAAELLYHVVKMKVDGRFDEVELTAIIELNHVLENIKDQEKRDEIINRLGIDKRFIYKMDVDIRISMAWDTDSTDIDLHVTDMHGEHCYYGHNRTVAGGLVSRDFTQGYGPEEFMQKKVHKNGKFKVSAKFYGNHQQTLTGGTTVLCTFFTHYLKPNEKSQCVTLRLTTGGQTTEVCEIDFKVGGLDF